MKGLGQPGELAGHLIRQGLGFMPVIREGGLAWK